MSLTSRVANLFSSSSTSPQQSRNEFGFVDDGVPAGKQGIADIKLGAERVRSDTMAQKAVEEEARPPYLHVRRHASEWEPAILTSTVYDRGRNRRDYRGFIDAFFGYGQDSPARRSAYSA